MRILIAEDDVPLANFLKKGLEAEHYAADVSPDGEQSRAMATEFEYDLVVLDLNMPRMDGVAILRHLRTKKPSVPILVLTGRTRVEDRVQCLDLGADDYLIKPFSFAELSARIRALLRRSHLPAESILTVDDLKLDRVERRVERSGKRIELTSKEFALLEYLMRNAGRRITRAMIIEHVWNLSFDTCTNVVDVYVMFNNSSGGDIGTLMSKFFSSLQQLSTDPGSLALRQAVLTAGSNLANGFKTTANNLQTQRTNLDLNVVEAVSQVNVLTKQIAKLNSQITSLQNIQKDASIFIDQRDELINQLSALVDVSVVQSDNGLTLTTSNGTALVAGQQSFDFTTQLDASGVQRIFSQGADITAKLTSGKLAGLLNVRDQKVPGLLTNLDTLASGFATAVNTAHRGGFDLNGTAGVNFFTAPPAGGVGAASAMQVAITDPALVAASSDGSPGSNGNVQALTAIHDQAIAGGQTAGDYYSNMVFGVGSDVSNASADLDAAGLVLRQLQDQQGSISAVSLDEEAANLLTYQRAFDAAGRMVSTVNEMLDVAINLGRY